MRRGKSVLFLILLALGILALIYGGFSYPGETHDADLGPIEFSVTEKEHVNVPVWAGAALVIVGAGGFLLTLRKT